MPRFLLLIVILGIAVIIYALFDCIMSRGNAVRSISKPAWILTILLVPLLGAGLWFLFGRPRQDGNSVKRRNTPRRPSAPDDDAQFLRNLEVKRRQEAREAELRRKEAELRAKEDKKKKNDDGGTATDGKTA